MQTTTPSPLDNRPAALLRRWTTVLTGCKGPGLERADSVTRWLVIARACVFSMTFTSGLIGLLLAAEAGTFDGWLGLMSLIGLIAAHGVNNLVNDWTDVRRGVDTEDYPRAQYSTHPILGGLTTMNGLLSMALALNLLDAAIMFYLVSVRGPLVLAFALAGLGLSLAYTGFLKRIGLGELTALVVWGPLMIGGTYFVATGALPPEIWLATLPFGVAVASVLVGKHIDKRPADLAVGVRSLPVLLGERKSLLLNKIAFTLFFLLVPALVALRVTGPWVLITFLALPRLVQVWRAYSQPRPSEPPDGWTVWPLWYVGWAMLLNRRAGELFTLGLFLNVLVPRLVAWLAQ
jgi:1,4-dihydroxy-2-naphthoate octaprenyltransferase